MIKSKKVLHPAHNLHRTLDPEEHEGKVMSATKQTKPFLYLVARDMLILLVKEC